MVVIRQLMILSLQEIMMTNVKNDYFYERDYYRDFKIENSRPILFKNYRMKLNETLKKYAK